MVKISSKRALCCFLVYFAVSGVAGCNEQANPIVTSEQPQVLSPSGPSFVWEQTGDESDYWETMTQTEPVYVELVAADQTPQPTDGLEEGKPRVCPNDQYIQKNAQLRMRHPTTGEDLDFEFRGPFVFQRHVSTTSPYPTALYKFNKKAYTYDKKYYAPAGNNVLLACDGNYKVNNSAIRIWAGYFYGKLYNGPIYRNPDYKDPSGGGDCDNRLRKANYDPYSPEGDCDGSGGGSGGGSDRGTVDWGTGESNGGSSACGPDARVEYVCIDYWDGRQWVEWSCGYATVC